MEKEKIKEISLVKKVKGLYFSQLIRINEEKQTSLLYIISVEILRFFMGHSHIYCIFMMKLLDNTENGAIYQSLRDQFKTNCLDNYQWIKVMSLLILLVNLFYIFMFFLKQQIQNKFHIIKTLFFITKYMKVTSQSWFCMFGVVFYCALKKNEYIVMILIVITLVITLILFKISVIYEQKNRFQSKDSYVHNQNLSVEIVNLMFCLLCFFGPLMVLIQAPDFIRIVIILTWILLQVLRLKNTAVYPYFQNQIVHKIYSFSVCLQFSSMAISTSLDFTTLEMISNNALSTIVIVTIFLYWGILNFNQYICQKSYFMNVEDLKTRQQFYLLINSYYSALQSLQRNSNLSQICLIVSSIRKNHQNSCRNSQCYCHKDTELKQFLQSYLYEMLLKLQNIYSHNHLLTLYIYSFKFHVYRYFTKVYQQLQSLQRVKQMNSLEMLLAMSLKYKLKKWIEQKNKQHKVISVCLAIRLQEDQAVLNDIIVDDIQIKYKKWNTFSKQLSRIQQIRNMSNKQIQNLIKIQTIKLRKWEHYNRSPSFNMILYFYFKRICLRNTDLGDLEQNIKELNRKVKQEELAKVSLFSKHLYHKNSCTIDCSIKQNSLGIILNTSKSIFRVFGYNSKRIIGENISCLIPPFLVKQHKAIMKEWMTTGSDVQDVSQVSQVYCQHKENYSFIALKYIKVFPGSEEITLIATFFKKNQNDLILISEKGQLQSYGKSVKTVLKHLPVNVECDFVFKNLKNKISNAQFNEQKQQKTVMFNQNITNQYVHGQKRVLVGHNRSRQTSTSSKESDNILDSSRQQSKSSKRLIGSPHESQRYLQNEQTSQFQDVWKINFTYKKVKMGKQIFFKLEAKGLQQVKKFEDFASNRNDSKDIGSQVQSISNSDKQMQNDVQMIEIGQQQNSSMASYSSQLGYGISKLLSHFAFILLNPKKLCDERLSRKLFFDSFLTFILLAILSTTLIINKLSLQEKTTFLKGKANIDRIFHLMQITTNHAFNTYMFKNDSTLKSIALQEFLWDSASLINELDRQLAVLNEQVTPLQGEVLYDYLKTPLNITFKNLGVKQVQLLTFFELLIYLFKDIQKQMMSNSTNSTQIWDDFYLLNVNSVQLRNIRDELITITQNTLAGNQNFNVNYLIISLVSFLVFTVIYGLYSNNYRSYRFHQSEQHIKLYQMIPQQILKSLTQYYAAYYKHYVVGKNRIDSCLDAQSQLFEQQFEQNPQSHQVLSTNKVKLVGKGKYVGWVAMVIIFIMLNGGNAIISYNMYRFNSEVQFFSELTNYISSSQSILLTRWIRLKGQYTFQKNKFNTTFLNALLSRVDNVEVMFDNYVTFQQNWITESDLNFRTQFNALLTTSPCILNKDDFTDTQLQICNSQAQLSKNGIITLVNSFSRSLRNIILEIQQNLAVVLNTTNYFYNQTQFREYDLAITFHVSTFSKMNSKIISVYENGFNTEYQTYLIVFILLVLLVFGTFVYSILRALNDKVVVSYLYGYILLFPASTLKQSKYLLKFIQTNLQFSEKH